MQHHRRQQKRLDQTGDLLHLSPLLRNAPADRGLTGATHGDILYSSFSAWACHEEALWTMIAHSLTKKEAGKGLTWLTSVGG